MGYLDSYRPTIERVLRKNGLKARSEREKRFVRICEFLAEDTDRLSWRGANPPRLTDEEGLGRLAARYLADVDRPIVPISANTVPDPAVSVVLKNLYQYPVGRLEAMKKEHQDAMGAENIVGVLLERYIASVAEKHEWCWCAGNFVKSIDFIMRTPTGWRTLQIKNRDNSENSSSSKVRAGTTIEKWSRTVAKTGKTKWEKFPDERLRPFLSEDGFQRFIAETTGNAGRPKR